MELNRRIVMASPLALATTAWAQTSANAPEEVAGIPVNYDEAKAGAPTPPAPLVGSDGRRVANADDWLRRRRPEILRLFETQQFGRAPGRLTAAAATTREGPSPALGGRAIRRQVRIALARGADAPAIDLLIYTPAAARGPVPLLLALGFSSNAATVADPGVAPGLVWDAKQGRRVPYVAGQRAFGRVDPLPLIDAGIGFATFYYGDVEPDDPAGFAAGIRARALAPGRSAPAPDEWGAIAAWAWGISRVIDHLETDRTVDGRRIAVHGVSRLGKTVMWAGARDTRIAATIASCSGEGGAALSRRNYGETIAHLVAPGRYPYQFCGNYARWAGFPDRAPMDGNLLIALHAPRPLLLQTGSTDKWSDPRGEFLAAVDAGQVYRLLGRRDLGTDVPPRAGEPIGGDLSFHMHEGGHGNVPGDWPVFVEFLRNHLGARA